METLPLLNAVLGYVKHPFALFFIAGVAGMVAHFYKKRLAGEVAEGLLLYVFCDYPKRSAIAFITFIAAEAAAFAAGGLEASPMSTLLGLGFTAGYTLDSACNKGFPT